MSVSGLCAICEADRAERSCTRCGSIVCEKHFERARGMCTSCSEGAMGSDMTDASPR